jgi:hypothetical protein
MVCSGSVRNSTIVICIDCSESVRNAQQGIWIIRSGSVRNCTKAFVWYAVEAFVVSLMVFTSNAAKAFVEHFEKFDTYTTKCSQDVLRNLDGTYQKF